MSGIRNAAIILLSAVVASSGFLTPSAQAAIQCYECHGTKSPVDYRPLDSPYRNISTGGFKGNHRTHASETSSPRQCERCHAGSSKYTQGHSNGKIQLSFSLNNSSPRALYDNRTSAWPQTPLPTSGRCSNVNCHFEATTPPWGSPLFAYPNDCSQCHGAPPSGNSTGAAGSHARHDSYFAGPSNCIKCHPGHTGFSHATSAGRALVVALRDPANIPAGSYNGPLDDYLPSRTNQFGSCANLYCHSSGTAVSTGEIQANITPIWGAVGPLPCTSCHAMPPSYPGGSPKANSHARHQARGYNCSRCHYGTTSDNATISGTGKHVNKSYDISSGIEPLSYTFRTTGGTCSNGYCHSNGTSVSTGIIPAYTSAAWGSGTIPCSSCHGYPPDYPNRTPKVNSHAKHNSYSYGCNTCHVGTTADGSSISDQTLHVNGRYDVNPALTVQFRFSSATGGGTCFTVSCHNDGTSIATGVPSSRNATWGKTVGCAICHGNRPSYPSGSPKANSHLYAAHKLNCSYCHYSTTTTGTTITTISNHMNGSYNVTPNNLISMNYTFAKNGGTCINTSCHATASGERRWGAQPDDCNGCHESPPNTPAHKRHFSGTALQASYTSVSIAGASDPGYLFNCANCHPRDINRHRDGFVDVELYDPFSPPGSVKALNPPEAAYAPWSSIRRDSRNYPYTNGTCSNVYCHSYMTWTTPGGVPAYTNYSSRLPSNLVATRKYRTIAWNSPSLTCTGCHANPPQTTAADNDGGAGNSHSWIDSYGYDNLHTFNMGYKPISCTTCHYKTVTSFSAYTTTGGINRMKDVPISNFSRHVNGVNDVDFDVQRGFAYPTSYYGQVVFAPRSTTYNRKTRTCSNISCHISEKSVVWGTPYRWYYSYECNRCHRH